MNTTEQLNWFKSSYSGGEGGECLEAAYTWRKSSYSSGGGGECLEVAYPWQKSSRSSGEGGDCVEVRPSPHAIHIRDSKHKPEDGGPLLTIAPTPWAHFLAHATA
ncbi:DUF397 domain-containing protein [Streptomyces sp. BG9H]|uniref:DUF397 domain-containing protein n=1 Tax=Streptomyces anatolicus TaxID=2675858 RepID=A0ABS6YVW3_9ACTN|nr:DUF397 domain-containing protein [Streptomyces anatolicus]MBW5425586.1 DUF397 domain-containing protein [Streptomyces anatolicus]